MGEVTATQLVIMKIAIEEAEDKAKILALMHIAFPFHKGDKNYPFHFIINPPWYNVAIMRYERNSSSFLCLGMRGFIKEGLSIHAPAA